MTSVVLRSKKTTMDISIKFLWRNSLTRNYCSAISDRAKWEYAIRSVETARFCVPALQDPMDEVVRIAPVQRAGTYAYERTFRGGMKRIAILAALAPAPVVAES
jgi:hypothetical protein